MMTEVPSFHDQEHPKLFEHDAEQTDQAAENEPFVYEQLVGHLRTDGSYKTTEQLRSQYVELTDEIIHKITTGVEVINPETGETEVKSPDYVVWLDKSARPVSWLTKELWSTLAKEEDGSVPTMPHFRYVNIDREQWINEIDPNGSGVLNVDNVSPSVIRSLRSVFVDPRYKREGLRPEIDEVPSELDGKIVMIVDEVQSTGRTLDMASKFFTRAFPETKFVATHWMKGQFQTYRRGEGSVQGNADLPVWYKEHDVTGRGVGNRDDRISATSSSLTQRLGGWFLSTTLPKGDEKSAQLRREIHQLGEDVRSGTVLVNPDITRDDFEERAERLNGLDFETYIKKRNELRDQKD